MALIQSFVGPNALNAARPSTGEIKVFKPIGQLLVEYIPDPGAAATTPFTGGTGWQPLDTLLTCTMDFVDRTGNVQNLAVDVPVYDLYRMNKQDERGVCAFYLAALGLQDLVGDPVNVPQARSLFYSIDLAPLAQNIPISNFDYLRVSFRINSILTPLGDMQFRLWGYEYGETGVGFIRYEAVTYDPTNNAATFTPKFTDISAYDRMSFPCFQYQGVPDTPANRAGWSQIRFRSQGQQNQQNELEIEPTQALYMGALSDELVLQMPGIFNTATDRLATQVANQFWAYQHGYKFNDYDLATHPVLQVRQFARLTPEIEEYEQLTVVNSLAQRIYFGRPGILNPATREIQFA